MQKRNKNKVWYLSLGLVICILLVFAWAGVSAPAINAAPDEFVEGDVFAAVGNGLVKRFSPDGTLLQTLDTTSGVINTAGMCFDNDGNLYVTNFQTNDMAKFDVDGNLLNYPWGGPFGVHPESCVLSQDEEIYTGEADAGGLVQKWDTDGNLLDEYTFGVGSRGTDWIDLAADQCTVYYTSEDSSIYRYDVCTETQLTPLTTSLTGGACFALRIRPDSGGEVLVACTAEVHRLDASGTIIQTYTPTAPTAPEEGVSDISSPGTTGGADTFFALNLDPNGTSFWTADLFTGDVYHLDIASGDVLDSWNAGIETALGGLAIFGEIVAGNPTDVSLTSVDKAANTVTYTWLALLLLVGVAGAVAVRRVWTKRG